MRISDWSSDVCSSDLAKGNGLPAALDAAHHNPTMKTFADRLRNAGKPHKVIIIAIARKQITLANALSKTRQKWVRSEEHTSELQSLMRISYAVFCLKKKRTKTHRQDKKKYDTKH